MRACDVKSVTKLIDDDTWTGTISMTIFPPTWHSLKKVQVGKDQEKAQSEKYSHSKKVQVGKDQENAQSEKDSHSKNRDGKKLN